MRRKNPKLLEFSLILVNFFIYAFKSVHGGGVFRVDYKFAGMEKSLSALRAHDSIRHLQIIAGVDLPIGGTGRPDAVGLGHSTFYFLFYFVFHFFHFELY